MTVGKFYEVPVYTLTVSGTDNTGNKLEKQWQVLRFMPFLNTNPEQTGYNTRTGTTPIMSGLSDKREQSIQSYNPNYEIHNTHSEENGGFVITGNFMIHDGHDDLKLESGSWGAAGCMEVVGKKGFSEMKQFIYSISGSNNPDMEKGLQEFVKYKSLKLNLEGAAKPPVVEH
ncbi:MAG: hypothetical protein LBH32_10420 [Dysgonamonadaceae bacterium]|nr:hypothetical protein [Dysgonamonadaceae bacterium]